MSNENKENKRQLKAKILDFFATIFYAIIAVGILAVLILGIFYMLGPVKSAVVYSLILVVFLLLYYDMKKTEKKKKAYQEKYISTVTITDSVFGEMTFEKDSAENTLICKEMNTPFGNYHPLLQIERYDEKEKELFFKSLEFLYSKQTEIIDNLLAMTAECLSLSQEELQKNFDVTRVCIQRYEECLLSEDPLDVEIGEWIIIVECNPDINKDSYCSPTPIAYMDCKTWQIDYIMSE